MATRKQRRARAHMVYPHEGVYPVLGKGSVACNLAIEAWATAIEGATRDNEDRWTAEEWEALAAAAVGDRLVLSAQDPEPGRRLAEGLRAFEGETGLLSLWLGPTHWLGLASSLAALDFVHAWAVAYSLKHYETQPRQDETGLNWWTVRHRRATHESK
jgi:hypothetical protein